MIVNVHQRSGPRILWPCLALLLGFWLTACSSNPTIEPLRPQAVPWANGELSTYEVIDLNDTFAGTATISFTNTATHVEGEAWTMRREVAAQGDQELVIVEMSAVGLRPAFSALTRLKGSAREQVNTTYNGGQADLELTTAKDVKTYERINVPSDARDQRTLLALARTLPLRDGYATQVNSFLPVANLLERVTIQVLKQEQVATPAGTYAAWLLKLSTPDSESQAWIATDAPYILVKFVDGRSGGTYSLQSYKAGQ